MIKFISITFIAVVAFFTLRSLIAYACERRRIWKTREKYGIPKHVKVREQRIITPVDEDMDMRAKLDSINWDENRIFLDDLRPMDSAKLEEAVESMCEDKRAKLADMAKSDEEDAQ